MVCRLIHAKLLSETVPEYSYLGINLNEILGKVNTFYFKKFENVICKTVFSSPRPEWFNLSFAEDSGPLFTKRRDVLLPNLVKTCKIDIEIFPIVLKFDRLFSSCGAKMPVILQSDTITLTSKLVASSLHVCPLSE